MSESTENTKGRGKKTFFKRRKGCLFCSPNAPKIDYKDVRLLQKFVSERGRLIPRRITGVSSDHQREIAQAVKRTRFLALLPYAAS